MSRLGSLTALLLVMASPAFAQHPPGHHPSPPAAPDPATPPADPAPPDDEAMPAMDWPTELPPGDAPTDHAHGMDHGAHGGHGGHDAAADDEAVGDEPPPPVPTDHPADAIFGEAAMRPAREALAREHGGMPTSKVMLDQAEWRVRDGENGFAWKGEAWYGGDENRVVVKTEGEGADGDLESGEVQALYSRALGPYFDLQVGLRQDLQSEPRRTYGVFGLEGLAPYWFDVEAALFVSNEGEVLARLEGSYDLRLTQRLILQPRGEIGLSGSDIADMETGAGVTDVELGLRLRYEIAREFAPYVGVAYGRTFGDTADYARAAGEDVDETSVVLGIRAWF